MQMVPEGDTQKRSVVRVSDVEFRPHARKDLRPHKLLGMGAGGMGGHGVCPCSTDPHRAQATGILQRAVVGGVLLFFLLG